MGSPEADHAMAVPGTLTCTAQVNSQILSFIARLWPRRLGLVDEQNGGTSNLQAGEIFKIRGGTIHEIEATGTSLPYGTKNPWD